MLCLGKISHCALCGSVCGFYSQVKDRVVLFPREVSDSTLFHAWEAAIGEADS